MLNDPILGFHLWYFYALIYALIIIYVARITKKNRALYRILPFLFLGGYLLSFGEHFVYYRNFLFLGLPYVLLGCLFRNDEGFLLDVFHKSFVLIGGLISFIGLGVEMFIYKTIGSIVIRDHYLFTFPMTICTFMVVLHYSHWGAGSFFARIGKKYSAYIYIMHLLVIILIPYGLKFCLGKEMSQNIMQTCLYKNSLPFLVFGVALMIVMIGDRVRTLFLPQKRN